MESSIPGRVVGIARISLDKLSFDDVLAGSKHRAVSTRNVARLREIFAIEGCKRIDEPNYISAFATSEILASGLLHTDETRNVPYIQVSEPLKCLNGLHRVRAAQEYLDVNDQWWTVKVLIEEGNGQLEGKLAEESLNEQPICDGQIFRKIRVHHLAEQPHLEQKWWARLSKVKRRDLKHLLRNDEYVRAFDSLLEWPGLWSSLQLGTLQRLQACRCDEEILRYIHHIRSTWSFILQGSEQEYVADAVDDSSVALLQSLAPYHSIKDMAVIVAGMEERRLFPLITESSARDRICHHISSIKGLIPSLYTLFESLKYLEPCSYALRALLPGKVKGTIRQELFACYRPTSTVVVQMQEMQYNQVSATTEAGRELAYWQLWLFAMRHFPDLTSTLPRKDKGRPKPLARPINVLVCRKFAGFAVRLGFVNPITRAYQNIDAERHLTDSIDNVSFTTYLNDVNHSAAMIAKGLAGNLAGLASSALPRLTGNAHVPIQQRVGRPFESSFEEDRDYLFLPYLACEARSDLYITTFLATTNLFSTFFGVDDENIAFAEATRHDDIEARHNNIEARNGAINERQENIDASSITFNEHDTEFRSNAFQMPGERNTFAERELIDDESLDAEFLRLSQGSGAQNHEIEEQVNAQSATSGPNASRLCLVLVHMTDNEPATLRQKSLFPVDIFKTEEMVSQIVHRIDESQQDFDPYHVCSRSLRSILYSDQATYVKEVWMGEKIIYFGRQKAMYELRRRRAAAESSQSLRVEIDNRQSKRGHHFDSNAASSKRRRNSFS